MAKRLTDSEKWKDEWFLSLDNDCRMIWIYIVDNCSHAGLLKKNLKLMNFCCNTNYDEAKINEIFDKRLIDLGDSYFIPKFIKFQYNNLTSNKPVIVSVIKELSLRNDYVMIKQSLENHSITIKSKSKDKSKDKDKSKEVLFRDSEFFDLEKFKEAFYSNANYLKYDVNYYYEAVKNWSESSEQKKIDWIATARGFAKRDEKENKAKLKREVIQTQKTYDIRTAHL